MVGGVIYPPPVTDGRAKEPFRDSINDNRFRCEAVSCDGPPFVALNAFENHPLLGNEADFVRGALASDYTDEAVERYRTVALVQPGDQLKVRLTVDNSADTEAIGAPGTAELTATDVRVRVQLPTNGGRTLRVSGVLESRVAQPQRIYDSLTVRSTTPIRLRLRPKTAGVLRASGLQVAHRSLFSSPGPTPPLGSAGGLLLGDIGPSFSEVTYVEFYLRVLKG